MWSILNSYLEKLQVLINAVECDNKELRISYAEGVEPVIDMLSLCRRQGKKIMWIGNGGSAAIAGHAAIDYWRTGAIKSVTFSDAALLTCIANDFGYAAVYDKPVRMFAESDDIMIAISSSGRSLNILNAVGAAKECRCKVITLSGFQADNPLRSCGDLNFYVPSHHYGHVELVHSVLCHSFLDLFMAREKGEITW